MEPNISINATKGRRIVCPICEQSDEVIPISNGEPTSKIMKKANKGEVKLGGCVIMKGGPNYYCKRDETSFRPSTRDKKMSNQ